MRIAHLIDTLEVGGAATVAIDLAVEQAARGHDVEVLTFTPGEWDIRVREAGLPITVGLRGVLRSVWRAEIAHCHTRRPGFLTNALPLRGKVVEHVHNMFHDRQAISFRGDAVIAVSQDVADVVRAEFPHAAPRLHLVRNGVAASRELTQPEKDVDLIGIGRLVEQKNPLYFLEVVAAVREMRPGVSALWVGDGELHDAFADRLRALDLTDTVTVLAAVDPAEIRRRIARARVLVSVSKWEGLPLVVGEALAEGTAVAHTGVGDLRSLLAGCTSCRQLPLGDAPTAAAAIVGLLGLDEAAVVPASKGWHARYLGFDRFVDEVGAVYDTLG